MTHRLYYDSSYLTAFDARVLETRALDGQPAVALDRTAFYPTSGGQPHDLGALNGVPVLDVLSDGDKVWHRLAAPVPDGAAARGQVDWTRRLDHMQNHSGQHILSQAFIQTAGALTVAWRLSDHSLTIDLDQSSLNESHLAGAERLANQVVQQNLPIAARIVTEQELPTLHLRKQPDVDGPLRIVEIGDFDRVACAGLHVDSSAQVGLVKILRAERRGPETRIHFVCGQRALDDYSRKHQVVRNLAGRFTCSEDELAQTVERLQAQADANFKALRAAQSELVAAEAARLLAVSGPDGVVSATYPGWDGDQVKQLAQALRSQPGLIIALAGGANQVLAGRSADVSFDAGQALRSALAAVGGRGGGRPDFAQGAAPSWQAACQAVNAIVASSDQSPNYPVT
jgi:alanyl-tRNA synthetase